MKSSHLALLLILNCGWASVPTLATRFEGRLGPMEFVFLRYAFALLGLAAVWPWLPGKLPRGGDFWRTVVMGISVFTVGHWLQIAGIQLSQASDSSILLAVDPLVSSLGAAFFLRERIPGRRWWGFGTAIAGVAFMSLWRREAPLPGLLANLLIVLSFMTEAVWSVMGKPLVRLWGIPKVTTLALAAGSFTNLLFIAGSPSRHLHAIAGLSLPGWFTLATLGIVFTAFGYSAWYLVIRETPVSAASMTIYLQPLVGTALAWMMTGDKLHWGHGVGAAAITGGLVLGLVGAGDSGERSLEPAAPEK